MSYDRLLPVQLIKLETYYKYIKIIRFNQVLLFIFMLNIPQSNFCPS